MPRLAAGARCRRCGWVVVSQPDAFPSVNPRPVAPDLIMRSWDVHPTTATHVLFRVLNNQCTGQTSFQGEQDNDPSYSTDCRVTTLTSTGAVALPARNTEVHASELQVLADDGKVRGAEERDEDHDD